MSSNSNGTEDVNRYLAGAPEPQRATLETLRTRIRGILPHADEAMKYGMPAFILQGKGIAGYAAFKEHCGYFPMSSEVLTAAGDAVDGYEISKGGLRFAVDRPPPMTLVRKLVKLRIAELADVTDGARLEFFGDGQLKATGRMKDGKLHGNWKWFRQDGSLLRAGRFVAGEQAGTWTTYDRAGEVSRTTRF